jgi:hypothetical protein
MHCKIDGIYFRDDKLPNNSKLRFILNLDKRSGNGTHLVCVINDFYFDPFGFVPPPEVIATGVTRHSTFEIQDIHEDTCGEYCLYVITQVNKRMSNLYEVLLSLYHI